GALPNIECKNIPLDELPDRIGEIPKDKFVAVFCPANFRSGMAYCYLLKLGFASVRIVEGGYAALTDAIKPGPLFKAVQARS
ncbi:MAG: rhodanese-like domain-containing protein, partial [Deltaproteobacteria bacterium]|nr:rhodanese-like domain-containing protein [Deltaproteobacteria bacterium]